MMSKHVRKYTWNWILILSAKLQLSAFVQQLIQYPIPARLIVDSLQPEAGTQPLEIIKPPKYLTDCF
jgi:hypothetical protein